MRNAYFGAAAVIAVLAGCVPSPEANNVIAEADGKAAALEASANQLDAVADAQIDALAKNVGSPSADEIADRKRAQPDADDPAGSEFDFDYGFYRNGKRLPGVVVLDSDVFGTLNGMVDTEVVGKIIGTDGGQIRVAVAGNAPQSDFHGILVHGCKDDGNYHWVAFSPPHEDEVTGFEADKAGRTEVDVKVTRHVFQMLCSQGSQ